jgi:hypothetical protein
MTVKPAIWYPIAVLLSVVNVVAAGFAAGQTEALHATTHAALALAFGLWAQGLRSRRGGSEPESRLEAEGGRLEALEGDVSRLRQELNEAQERLDFFERLLARGPEVRKADPER